MDNNLLLSVIPFFIFGSVVIGVVFMVVAIVEGRHTTQKGSVIKQVYFYLVSMITLMLCVVAIGFLLNLGLKALVFKQADTYEQYKATPPPLYLSIEKPEPMTEVTCQTGCELSSTQKDEIQRWTIDYSAWQDSQEPEAKRQRDLVASLSILLVSLPLFFIHYRVVQRDAKAATLDESSGRMIRPTYFYVASFIGLGMIIVFGALFINLGLKTYIFPKADTTAQNIFSSSPMSLDGSEAAGIRSIANCKSACSLSEETTAAASQYLADFETRQNDNQSSGRRQSEAAMNIAFLGIAIPLFIYHWRAVRREGRPAVTESK